MPINFRVCGWAAALAFLGCSRAGPEAAAGSRILRVSQRNEPASLDPSLSSLPDDFFIIRALSEGLVTLSTDWTAGAPPQPQAAAASSWDTSPDGRVWTFHLRASARWSNGEPVTAADFVATYHRLLTPATGAPKAGLFFAVRHAREFVTGAITDFAQVGFRALDPATLEVTLEHPDPFFLAYAASGPWIPVNARAVAQFGRRWTEPEHYVGNGPFLLTAWEPHQRIRVRKNPRYDRADRIQLDGITFVAFDDKDAEERAFRTGEIDVTMAVPFAKLATYRQEHPEELRETAMAETRFLTFNTAKAPLSDPRVRQALSLALDRERLARIDGQAPATALVSPALQPGPADPGSPAGDPAEAQRLLAAAGFPGGRGFPTLELSSWARSEALEAIQEMWKKQLGIRVDLTAREARVHLSALRSGHYDIGYMTAIPDVPDALNLLEDFTTGASANYPHWSNAAFDAAVARARESATLAGRRGALRQAAAIVATALPVAPLSFYTKHWLIRPAVHGWREDALWTRSYLDLALAGAPPKL